MHFPVVKLLCLFQYMNSLSRNCSSVIRSLSLYRPLPANTYYIVSKLSRFSHVDVHMIKFSYNVQQRSTWLACCYSNTVITSRCCEEHLENYGLLLLLEDLWWCACTHPSINTRTKHNSFIARSAQPIVTPLQVVIFSLFKVLLLGDVQIIGSLHWL